MFHQNARLRTSGRGPRFFEKMASLPNSMLAPNPQNGSGKSIEYYQLNKEGMTTQPLEETVTIAECKVPIKTSKRYTSIEGKYNTIWGCVNI